MGYELFQSFQVLCVKLYVVVPSPFNPQWLHGAGTALVHGQAVGEIDDLVLCTVNDQHRRGDLRDLVNAAKQNRGRERGSVSDAHGERTSHLTARR